MFADIREEDLLERSTSMLGPLLFPRGRELFSHYLQEVPRLPSCSHCSPVPQ